MSLMITLLECEVQAWTDEDGCGGDLRICPYSISARICDDPSALDNLLGEYGLPALEEWSQGPDSGLYTFTRVEHAQDRENPDDQIHCSYEVRVITFDPKPYDKPMMLGDICEHYGIEPAAACLRAIDKHGDSGATVSIRLPDGTFLCTSSAMDLKKIRDLGETTADKHPVKSFVVHGIAWDGSDWEFSEEVTSLNRLDQAIENFKDALSEHRIHMEEYNSGD